MNAWESAARFACKVPDADPPWRWAEKNIVIDKTSPFPGNYRSDTAPWTREPLEKAADNRIRRITIRCAAQTSKTQTCMILASYWIAEDPGPMMWVMAAQDEAKTFARTRLMPTLEACKPVADQFPEDRHAKSTLEINFHNSPLIINGANSMSKLQSKPIRYLILDEVRNYPKGALQTVLKRTTSFWNARELIISTGDTEGDDVDREFHAGDQRRYFVPCPHCALEGEMQFKQLKWDENNETRPAGEWNWDALAATIRYECPACKEILRDSFAVRRSMALAGKWVPTNKKSPSDRVSYTWSALIVPWIPWIRIVQEFLMAKEAMDQGAHEPLKTFITETLGESWREQEMFGDDIMEPGGFRLGDPWPEESLRFMTVDVQKDHFWFVVRSWSKEGESRLVAEGKIQTVADIKDTAAAFKVPDRCVIMDCGYEQNRIFQVCCANGWVAFKGDERASFSTYHGGGIREVRPYSWPPLAGDPGLGTVQQGMQRCPFFMWSNPTVKDFLYRLKTGKGLGWGLPADVSAEYMRQMCSEAKRRTRNKKTGQVEHQWQVIGRRQNHLWDCECMQLVAAMIEGILVNPFATSKPVKDPDSQPVGDTVA